MKYAFMSFSCPELDLDQFLALAKRFGYEGIEPRISEKHKHGIELDASAETRRVARDKAQAAGIAICCVATSCVYADPAKEDQMVADTLRAIDLAADVAPAGAGGSPRIRVFGGQMPKDSARDEAVDQVSKCLESVAAHAAERGVTVCMETHDDWCNPAHVAAVMRRVNHPAIAVNWDIMHPIRQGGATMDSAFDALKPWIRHVHFHDGHTKAGNLELCPIGQGDIDHKRAVALLQKSGYPHFLSGEWIGWEPYETHLPRELATMKQYERETA